MGPANKSPLQAGNENAEKKQQTRGKKGNKNNASTPPGERLLQRWQGCARREMCACVRKKQRGMLEVKLKKIAKRKQGARPAAAAAVGALLHRGWARRMLLRFTQ